MSNNKLLSGIFVVMDFIPVQLFPHLIFFGNIFVSTKILRISHAVVCIGLARQKIIFFLRISGDLFACVGALVGSIAEIKDNFFLILKYEIIFLLHYCIYYLIVYVWH